MFSGIFKPVSKILGGFTQDKTSVTVDLKPNNDNNFKFSSDIKGGKVSQKLSGTIKRKVDDYKFGVTGTLDSGKGNITGVYTVENPSLVKGLKITETLNICTKEVLKTDSVFKAVYKDGEGKLLDGSFKFAKKLTRKSPIELEIEMLKKYQDFSFALKADLDVNPFDDEKELLSKMCLCLAGNFTQKDYFIAAKIYKKFSKCAIAGTYKVDDKTNLGLEVIGDIKSPSSGEKASNKQKVTIGVSHVLADGSTVKAKVDTLKGFGINYSFKVAPNVKGGISYTGNFSDIKEKAKIGLNFTVS